MQGSDRFLQELAPGGLWVGERPVWFSGVRMRARMTVVRLANGRLWVHSPCEPTAELCQELDALGEVSFLVVPNRYHHLRTPAMKERYPQAQVIGPVSARPRNPRLELDLVVDDGRLATFIPDFSAIALRGVPFLDETLFFHHRTQTLIGADLMMCACARDHWTWRWSARVWGQYERYKAPPDVRWNTRGGPLVRQSIAELAQLPLERILVAHSDPIEDRPMEQLREAWRFALG